MSLLQFVKAVFTYLLCWHQSYSRYYIRELLLMRKIITRIVALVLLVVLASSEPGIWPQPISLQYNPSAKQLTVSPCQIKYTPNSLINQYLQQHINFYLTEVFKCQPSPSADITLTITVASSNTTLPTETTAQKYSLILRQSGKWQLNADYYIGFLRGFETFSQLFAPQQDGSFTIQGIPIVIDDKPEFKWRGLMIDSSRHFLPVSAIKKTINALLFNKMNILHWHIIDQDSFPFQIPTLPELSQFGKIGGTYSPQEVQQVIAYAKLKGVRVIVQIDTPAHTHSWGRSEKYHENIVRCNLVYTGQFDPTLESTYDLVNQVMKYVNTTFADSYVHFGGDETLGICWNLKPSISQWMKENNVANYTELQILYRKKQKQLWRKISPTKKAIYWANQQLNLPLQADDVIHWWGFSSSLNLLANKPNQVILSSYDHTYIDKGFGNRNGIPYGDYIKWRDLYGFNPRVEGVKVIGGQTCMWSELSNIHTHDQKIWIRTSVLAERLWNDGVSLKNELLGIATRLQKQAQRMRSRGYKVSPVTVQLCEEDMTICF